MMASQKRVAPTISHFRFPLRIARYSGQLSFFMAVSVAVFEFGRDIRTVPLTNLRLVHLNEWLKYIKEPFIE